MNNTTVTEDLLRTASRFWLMKSEPGECSIDDALAAPGRRVSWFGIRNYQARNFMRDDMTIGDAVLFYHSSCAKPGIAGIARIASDVYPDELQFDPESEYYDPKSTKENPRWLTLDVEALFKCPVVEIGRLREEPELAGMRVLQKGNRLSITPVEKEEFAFIVRNLLEPEGILLELSISRDHEESPQVVHADWRTRPIRWSSITRIIVNVTFTVPPVAIL